MRTGPHFHAGDRVRTRCPMGLFDANRCGIILRAFFGADLYDVLFDGQTEPRLVVAEKLIKEMPAAAHETTKYALAC
jgi:hypothetical protein